MDIYKKKFRKIPIIIQKWEEDGVKGWRCEIADTYENYKPEIFEKINFTDLTFNFFHPIETHEKDDLVFYTRKDAVAAANHVIKTQLNGKGKIYHLTNKMFEQPKNQTPQTPQIPTHIYHRLVL